MNGYRARVAPFPIRRTCDGCNELIYMPANKIMNVSKAIIELSDQEFITVQRYRMSIRVIGLYC